MSKQALATLPASEADLHAARALAIHHAAKVRGMEFKLLAYYAGLELKCLKDAHAAEFGETRGKKSHDGTFMTLEAFMRSKTGLPKTTLYRYLGHYDGLVSEHAETAAKLNAHYQKAVEGLALGEGGAALALASPEAGGKLSAKLLQEFAASADGWGLAEIFNEEPDAEEDEDGDGDDDDDKPARVNPTVKFFRDFMQRVKAGEFERLPKATLRQLAASAEQVAKQAKAILEGKVKPEGKSKA